MLMHKLNWKRDPHLARFPKHSFALEAYPLAVDLRSITPPVVNQGQLGSCTGNAWCYLLGSLAKKGEQTHVKDPEEFNGKFVPLSRLFVYWNERALQGTTNQDSGATLTEGMQSVQRWGVCRELTWPYHESLAYSVPSHAAYAEAVKHKAPLGLRVDNSDIQQLKSALAAGYPFVFGMDVYESFMQVGSDGMVPMPNYQYEQLMGGHALCCVGYDDHKQCFTIVNSWGDQWGDNGFCYIPYAYLTDQSLASDFWTLRIGK